MEIVIPQALRKNAKQKALWGACLEKLSILKNPQSTVNSRIAQDHVFLCGRIVVIQRQWGVTEILMQRQYNFIIIINNLMNESPAECKVVLV